MLSRDSIFLSRFLSFTQPLISQPPLTTPAATHNPSRHSQPQPPLRTATQNPRHSQPRPPLTTPAATHNPDRHSEPPRPPLTTPTATHNPDRHSEPRPPLTTPTATHNPDRHSQPRPLQLHPTGQANHNHWAFWESRIEIKLNSGEASPNLYFIYLFLYLYFA